VDQLRAWDGARGAYWAARQASGGSALGVDLSSRMIADLPEADRPRALEALRATLTEHERPPRACTTPRRRG